MKGGRIQLALPFLACFSSLSSGSLFGNENDGKVRPMDPVICETQSITFTSTLLKTPELNYSIGFAVKNRNTNREYVAVDPSNVTVINETISTLTMENINLDPKISTEIVYFFVKSYYWKEHGDIRKSLLIGKTTSTRIYPIPEKVKDFKCIVTNYKTMKCSWTYGKSYGENMPEVKFQWKNPSDSNSWTDCAHLQKEQGYCYWNGTRAGDFKNMNITMKLTLTQKCGINVTSEYAIDTSTIVKTNPPSSLSSAVINSTCALLAWDTTNSEPHYPKEHMVVISSGGVTVRVKSYTTTKETEGQTHSRTFCDLHPYTEYVFSVSIKPTDTHSGYFSDPRTSVLKTYSDIPSESPEVIDGGYTWDQRDCNGINKKRRVCIFLKSIEAEHKNGPMKGLLAKFTALDDERESFEKDWPEDTTYSCSVLQCTKSYRCTMKARNVNGTSKHGSNMTIPSSTSGIKRPEFIVESANTSDVFISLVNTVKPVGKEYLVVWCRNENGKCKPGHEVNWKMFPSNLNEFVIQTSTSAQDYLYGVNVKTELGSSGVDLQECVYRKDTKPTRKPENVVVSAGSEDNTLVVTWDKLTCTSDEPFIEMYSVQYKKLGEKNPKSVPVLHSGEARLVLKKLVEDQTYEVTVIGITRGGQNGPESVPQTGVPINKSLKPGSIVGISLASLGGAIFAGVGLFCAVRICQRKAQRAIKQAGTITIPKAPSQELFTSFRRQNSSDSGFEQTPPPDKCSKEIDFNISPVIMPDDYRRVTINNEGKANAVDNTHTHTVADEREIVSGQSTVFVLNTLNKSARQPDEMNSKRGVYSNGNHTSSDSGNDEAKDLLEIKHINDVNNDTGETVILNESTQQMFQTRTSKTDSSFRLGNGKLLLSIPCPKGFENGMDSSFSNENLQSEDSCQEASVTTDTNLSIKPEDEYYKKHIDNTVHEPSEAAANELPDDLETTSVCPITAMYAAKI